MALGSADPRAVASAEGFFVGNPSDVLLSPVDPDGYAYDYAINLAFNIGTLAAGASDTSSFAMIFGADQQAVASQFDVIAAGWPPIVTIGTNKASVRADETATLTFTLTKPSTTLTSSAVTVTGGTLSNFAGSGTNYTATFTPTAGYGGPATVMVAAGSFTDANGIANIGAALAAPSYVDAILPAITITANKAIVKAGATAVITFRLSEVSKDFTASDVAVKGGMLTNFAGTGATYTATFTPSPGFDGSGTFTVAAGSFTDAFGNPNTVGVLDPAISVDTIAPTIAIAADKTALKAGEASVLTFTLSEAPVSFTQGMVAVTGGVLSNFAGSGTSYTAKFTPTAGFTGSGTVSVVAGKFSDAAGNASLAGVLSPALVIDAKPPTVAVTSSLQTLKAGTTAVLTFRLSESSTTFTASDVAVTGGTLTNFAGSGTTYTATFTPTAGLVGSGTVAVDIGAFTDAAGNPSVAGALATPLRIDMVVPTVAITADKTALKSGETSLLTFTLSETPASFTAAMVSVTGGTLSNFTGSGSTYTAKFTPTANFTGTGTVSVLAGKFTDAAGNANVTGTLAGGLAIAK